MKKTVLFSLMVLLSMAVQLNVASAAPARVMECVVQRLLDSGVDPTPLAKWDSTMVADSTPFYGGMDVGDISFRWRGPIDIPEGGQGIWFLAYDKTRLLLNVGVSAAAPIFFSTGLGDYRIGLRCHERM